MTTCRLAISRGLSNYQFARVFPRTLGERDELGIPWHPIWPNVIPGEPALCIYPSRLVKPNSSILHDLLHFSFGLLVEASSRITGCYIGSEVEVARGEARLDIDGKRGGEAGVDVFRYRHHRDQVGPTVAGKVEGWLMSVTVDRGKVWPGWMVTDQLRG